MFVEAGRRGLLKLLMTLALDEEEDPEEEDADEGVLSILIFASFVEEEVE